MARLIAIDPGASGSAAYTDLDRHPAGLLWRGWVRSQNLPRRPRMMVDFFGEHAGAVGRDGLAVVIEQAGYYRSGFSATAAAKFARACGQMEAAACAHSGVVYGVYPHAWMRLFAEEMEVRGWVTGRTTQEQAARKRVIRDEVARRVGPSSRVTLRAADSAALLLLTVKLLTRSPVLPEVFHVI